MLDPKIRSSASRQGRERHEDIETSAPHSEREYRAGGRQGPSAANYPQYVAENRRFLHDPHGYQDRADRASGQVEYGTGEYRYGDQPRFSPLRFGSFDEVRNDSFGYTETIRQPHSFGPYVQGGGNASWQPHPGYYDPTYANVGMNWDGPGYLHHPDQFRPAPPDADWPVPRGQAHHADSDYRQWRAEQIRKLDSDYAQWRQERYRKFSQDFDTWRSTRAEGGSSPSTEPDGQRSGDPAEQTARAGANHAPGIKR